MDSPIELPVPNPGAIVPAPDRPARPARIAPLVYAFFAAVALGFAGVVALAVVIAAALAAAGGPGGTAERLQARMAEDPLIVLAFMLPFEAALVLVALLTPRLEGLRVRAALGLVPAGLRGREWAMIVAGSIVPLAVGLGAAAFMPSMGDGEGVVRMWKTMPPLTAAIWIITIGLAPGFCEEMFFRGLMQRRLLARLRPAWAIGITSVLFAVVHVDPATAAMALVLGVWLGVVAWRTGSIRPTIAIHATINAGWNLLQVTVRRAEPSDAAIWTGVGAILLLALPCFAASVMLLARRSPPAAPGLQTAA